MKLRQAPITIHLLGAAVASALAAYWILKLVSTPVSPVAAVAGPALAVREPDARLAARLFGDLNSGPAAVARNVQVSGVYADGHDSSAVIAVDGKPSRAVMLDHEAAPGLRLVEVRVDGITLEYAGARTEYAVPPISVARATVPTPLYRRDGNVLTAPTLDPSVPNRPPAAAPAPGRFSGAVAPPPPPGMLMPPRGGSDEPGGRLGQPGPGTPQAFPSGG
jgi:hypothetical protein